MRTTIDLDEELLRTAKSISEVRGVTLSKVIGDLAWRGLRPSPEEAALAGGEFTFRNGFPVLPLLPGGRPVTPEHIAELLEKTDIKADIDELLP